MKYDNKLDNPVQKLIKVNQMRALKKKRKFLRGMNSNHKIEQIKRKVKGLTPEQLLKQKMLLRKNVKLKTGTDNGLSSNKVTGGKIQKSHDMNSSEKISKDDQKVNKLYKLNLKREEKGLPPLTTVPLDEASSVEFFKNSNQQTVVLYNSKEYTMKKFIELSKMETGQGMTGDIIKILGDLKSEMNSDKSFSGNLLQYIDKHYVGNDEVTDIRKTGEQIRKTKDYLPKKKEKSRNSINIIHTKRRG